LRRKDEEGMKLFGIGRAFAAGHNLSHKFPARDTVGQMGHNIFAFLNGNPVVYESSNVFAAQVCELFLVSAFVRHALSLRRV
jgi:hypothetical protein